MGGVNVPPPPPDPPPGPPPGPWDAAGYPPGPPGYGPGPWGAMPPGYGPGSGGTREHPDGTTILVLGIVSIVLCQLIGPIPWVMGSRARKAMDAQPGVVWTNRGSVTAGWVLGIISTIIFAVTVLAFVAVVVIAILAGGAAR